MARSLDDVRRIVMELPDEDRQLLAEEIIAARWPPRWREAWLNEAERRLKRMESGEDPGLTMEEFFSDEDPDPREVEQSWIDEAERRYDQWRAGRGTSYSAEEVIGELRAKFGEQVDSDDQDQ